MKKHASVRFSIWLALAFTLALAVISYGSTTTSTAVNFPTSWTHRAAGGMETSKTLTLYCGGTQTCPAGTYEIAYNLGVRTAATAGSGTLVITAHDGNHSRTKTSQTLDMAFGLPAGGHTNSTGADHGVFIAETAGTGNMSGTFTITSASGSANAYINVNVRRLR